MTTSPFPPPAAPVQPIYPAPPPPKRKGRVIVPMLIVAITLLGLAAIGAVAYNGKAPAAAPATTEARAATTTRHTTPSTEESSEVEEAPEVTAWTDIPGVIEYALDAERIMDRTGVLTQTVIDALEADDYVGAAQACADLAELWDEAPDAPHGVPFRAEWAQVKRKSVSAYTLAAEAFVTLDVDKADQALDQLTEVAALMRDLNDEVDAATGDL